MAISARRFRTDEADAVARIRLEALADAPAAFAERLDAALAQGGEDFSAELAQGAIWGVFDNARCVGMAGLDRHVGANVAHKATVWGVYVSPAARGSGAADALFEAIEAHARKVGVEQLHLGVGEANGRARRFYARRGFEPYGLEREAVKMPDGYVDEVLMVLSL